MKHFTQRTTAPVRGQTGAEEFKELEATELYCPRCKRAVNVRKYLLLVLPDGDKYEYRCAFCNEAVGSKIDRDTHKRTLIV